MLRKFSDELAEDREFEFGGEAMSFRLFHWTETVDLLDIKPNESLVINEDGSFSYRADTEYCIKEIPRFLDAESAKKFKAVVARKQDPVPRHQIVDLYLWLRQQVQGLPTTPPSSVPLDDGAGSNGAESSDVSPSTEVPSTA